LKFWEEIVQVGTQNKLRFWE